MFKSIKIVIKLFKKSFIVTGILYFISLILFLSIIGLKDAYKISLEKEFATKQAHIKVLFIDEDIQKNDTQISEDINYLKLQSNLIEKVSPFTYGDKFFTSLGFKEGGNSFYNGNIKIIGLGSSDMVYDFYNSTFVNRKPFELKYTPLEFIYSFKQNQNIMIFNRSLFYSFFPVIESTEEFLFENKQNRYKGKLASIFNDYDNQPIIYTTLNFANKLLNNKKDKISGYYINVISIEDIEQVANVLKETLPKNKYSVNTWLEDREKQFMMFSIFESISIIIVLVIELLAILFTLLLLYNAIVKKSYQLSVLYTIGYKIEKEIFLSIFTIMFIVSISAVYILSKYLVDISDLFNLSLSKSFLYNTICYTTIIDIIFIVVSYLLIKGAYKLKAKSIF